MSQLPPYLFGMIDKIKMEIRINQALKQIHRALRELDADGIKA